jgi:hypothetical protein
MTRNKLKKLRQKLAGLRGSSPKADELEKLAAQLGRRKVNRGKEPTWESDDFLDLRPLSIPHHGGKDLAPGTKRSILNQLEDDLISWDERLTEEELAKDIK